MSATGLTPDYNVIVINMADTDGVNGRFFSQQMGFLQVAFRDAFGNPVSNKQIRVAFGQASEDQITLDYNGKVRVKIPVVKNGVVVDVQTCDNWRVFWTASSGVFAHITISQDSTLFENDTPNPLQSFTASIGATVTAASVTVGTSAVIVSAASSSRQSVIIQNLGAADIFIGGIGVTVAQGLRVSSGQSATLDKNIAAIYAISGTAGQDARVLAESI